MSTTFDIYITDLKALMIFNAEGWDYIRENEGKETLVKISEI